MTVVKQYIMDAAPGQRAALRDELAVLTLTLKTLPGFEGGKLLADADHPQRLIFMEFWASIQAYQAGAAHLPKQAFAGVMPLLAAKPTASMLNEIELRI